MGILLARSVLRVPVEAPHDAAISAGVAKSAALPADGACSAHASRLVTTRRCAFET
jgi:hypothetical protein